MLLFCLLATSLRAQKKAEFTYPEDALADTAKKSFEKQFKQGKILYNLTCSKCHNMKVEGKDVIPDFSLPQLMDYEMRIYPQHVEELPDAKLADYEMQKIIVFLRYKTRTGKTIHPPPKENR
jgi:cytochrome c553